MRLKVWQVGEMVLRQAARPLARDEILDRGVQDLIVSMRETMHDAPGVGLAAPQVGVPVQLVVIEDRLESIQKITAEQALERKRTPVPFHVLINPTLTIEDAQTVEFFEGCLSVSGFTAIVPRATHVRVEYLSENAEPMVRCADGWYARILQHEIDHLSGVLYIDRMKPRTLSTQDNYIRYWKEKPVSEVLV